MDPSLVTGKIRAALGACALGRWPTPLELTAPLAAAAGLDALWVKREDHSAVAYGGNKVRGLEFLIAGALPGTVFVTLGGTGSTHCLATAVHARALSCGAVLAQFPQASTEASRAVAAACERAATGVVRAGSRLGLPLAVARAWRMARRIGRARWIPGGGAHPRAVVGHLLAGLELASQSPSPPDAVVTPLGSGGTAAGLMLAFGALGWPTRVIAARVAPMIVANRWRVAALSRGAMRLLAAHGIVLPRPLSFAPLVLDCLGQGYGFPTAAGEAARALAAAHSLALDPTYGAKAFAALASLPSRGFRRVVFWHTFAFPARTPELSL